MQKKTKSNIKFSNKSFQDFLHHSNAESLFITPKDTHEVNLIRPSLNSDKSTAQNILPTKILKLLKHDISPHLAEIFNLSFSSGVFQSILKIPKVLLVHKKVSKQFCSNYRPISLLSNIDKIIEKIMYDRIYKFLDKTTYILFSSFRQHYSTSYALLNLTETIMKALDDGNFAWAIFVYLQKAFDTVDQSILLSKLSHYGIRGLENKWSKSYSANRKQFVSINGFESSASSIIICGVPQGSVLGPLPFHRYINDLHVPIKHCKVHYFADDKNLLIIKRSLKRLNKLLNIDLKNLTKYIHQHPSRPTNSQNIFNKKPIYENL